MRSSGGESSACRSDHCAPSVTGVEELERVAIGNIGFASCAGATQDTILEDEEAIVGDDGIAGRGAVEEVHIVIVDDVGCAGSARQSEMGRRVVGDVRASSCAAFELKKSVIGDRGSAGTAGVEEGQVIGIDDTGFAGRAGAYELQAVVICERSATALDDDPRAVEP
jgi:hypothetical protein